MKLIAQKLVNLLMQYQLTVTTAESCTAGLVSSAIASVSGASAVLDGAIVTYATAVKGKFLEIDPSILYEKGVVSPECVVAMAEGAAKLFHADTAIAVTGYAGPGGGDPENPVGTVYIAVSTAEGEKVKLLTLSPKRSREFIRICAATNAMSLALKS